MSFQRRVYCFCDGADCPLNGEEACAGDPPYTTVKEYRDELKAEGWVFRRSKTYCPDCARRLGLK